MAQFPLTSRNDLNKHSDFPTHLVLAPVTAWLRNAWEELCVPVPLEYPNRLGLKYLKISAITEEKIKTFSLYLNSLQCLERLTWQRSDSWKVSISTNAAKAHVVKWLFLTHNFHSQHNYCTQCIKCLLYLQDKPLYCVRTSRMLFGLAPIPFPACSKNSSSSLEDGDTHHLTFHPGIKTYRTLILF